MMTIMNDDENDGGDDDVDENQLVNQVQFNFLLFRIANDWYVNTIGGFSAFLHTWAARR